MTAAFDLRVHLLAGQVIPAHPLALDTAGHLDERHQRALTRYYAGAGAGGIAVGVHTTQFAIREHGLLEPVLSLAAETLDALESDGRPRMARVAGVCGLTGQAVAEAALARDRGYHAGLLSYAGWGDAADDAMLEHARAVGEIIPVFGFYLQPAVGGRPLGYDFWRRFAELDCVAAPGDRSLVANGLPGTAAAVWTQVGTGVPTLLEIAGLPARSSRHRLAAHGGGRIPAR